MEHSHSDSFTQERALQLEQENMMLQKDLERIQLSRSWRWTMPLRKAEEIVHSLKLFRRVKRKILYIDSQLPRTDRDSGSVRLSAILRLLARRDTDITFIPFDLEDYPMESASLENLGIRVLCGNQIDSIEAHLQAEGSTYDLIIACRMPLVRQYIEQLRHYAPQAKIAFDTVDLHFQRLRRRAELENNNSLRSEADLWKEHETTLMRDTDCTIVVSDVERAYLADLVPEVPVFVISNIHQVLAEPVWSENRTNILFLGNFHHPPNIDAARHLVHAILPLVRSELPEVSLDIVGVYPPGTIEDLAGENVHIHGHVADLEPFFGRARTLAAPLRYGAGVKGKLHMSMAYGVPFVTTPIGAESMHVQHHASALIADDEQAFARCIVRLYRDRELWEKIAASAQAVLREKFSVAPAAAEMKRMLSFLDKR